MLHHIKHTIKNNRTIISNIFSLGTLQIFSYILPLITLPYITRVVGPENYGIVAFAGAFVAYFLIFVNYGFNLTATRDISINRENREKVSEIFWNVIFIKLGLGIIATLVSLVLVFSFDIFHRHILVFIFSLLAILGEILFPVWLFQGMERMKYITIINVVIRTLFLIPIFVYIREAGDYVYLPLIASLSSITIGIIAFIISVQVFHISFILPNSGSMIYHLREGWHVFISGIFISLYTTSTTFILGIFTTPTIVGYYAVADRIIRAILALFGPISQSIYPTISQKLIDSKEKTIVFLRKLTILVGSVTFFVSLALFFSSGLVINLLFGNQYSESILVLRILAFLPFIISVNTVFSNLVMLNFGYKKEYSVIYISFSILSIATSIPLTILYSSIGLSLSVLFTEIGLAIFVRMFLLKEGIRLV